MSHLSPSETREMARNISEIVSAGLPLEGGLAAIAEEFPNGRLRSELRGIVRGLEAGHDLESVLKANHSGGYLPALIRAGVRSGKTGEILENFVAGTQAVSDLQQSIWMALAYPLILIACLTAICVFLLMVIVPQFQGLFQGWGITLPWLTRMVLSASEFVVEHGFWALLICVSAVVLTIALVRLILGQAETRRFIWTIPFIGTLVRCSALARFAPVLSLLIEGGVPLDEALALAGDASGDVAIRDDCRQLAAGVRAGKTLEEAATTTTRFPATFVRALSWERYREGFSEIVRSMSDTYAGRARALVAILVAVMPVFMVVFVGCFVILVVVALFMPLFELLNKLF